MYRLLACISDKFDPITDEFIYEIYHLSVGDEDIIYTNGVLSETFNLEWYERDFFTQILNITYIQPQSYLSIITCFATLLIIFS